MGFLSGLKKLGKKVCGAVKKVAKKVAECAKKVVETVAKPIVKKVVARQQNLW